MDKEILKVRVETLNKNIEWIKSNAEFILPHIKDEKGFMRNIVNLLKQSDENCKNFIKSMNE